MNFRFKLTAAASGVAILLSAAAAQADVLFWSTQAKPVEEAQAMREQVLAGFGETVDYQPNDGGPWLTRLQAELQAGSGSIGVLGALHGDFSAMNPDDLVDLDDLGIASASDTFNELATLGTGNLQYIPWMQASYIMAANKEALQYLPDGADIDALDLRPADRLGGQCPRGHRRAEVRLPGRSQGAEAPLLPGLPVSLLHRRRGAHLRLRRGGDGVGKVPRAVGAHQSGLDQLLLHAGAIAVG